MSFYYGSIPIFTYPSNAEEVPIPPSGFFLITDLTNLLMANGFDNLLTAGA